MSYILLDVKISEIYSQDIILSLRNYPNKVFALRIDCAKNGEELDDDYIENIVFYILNYFEKIEILEIVNQRITFPLVLLKHLNINFVVNANVVDTDDKLNVSYVDTMLKWSVENEAELRKYYLIKNNDKSWVSSWTKTRTHLRNINNFSITYINKLQQNIEDIKKTLKEDLKLPETAYINTCVKVIKSHVEELEISDKTIENTSKVLSDKFLALGNDYEQNYLDIKKTFEYLKENEKIFKRFVYQQVNNSFTNSKFKEASEKSNFKFVKPENEIIEFTEIKYSSKGIPGIYIFEKTNETDVCFEFSKFFKENTIDYFGASMVTFTTLEQAPFEKFESLVDIENCVLLSDIEIPKTLPLLNPKVSVLANKFLRIRKKYFKDFKELVK
ncbi:hypothetical protein [Carp edema virus]|nr:hypothetical protein [Carp edema virus]